MNENLYGLFDDVFVTDFSITGDDYKKESVLLMTAGAPYYENALFWYGIYAHMGWVSLGEVLGDWKRRRS